MPATCLISSRYRLADQIGSGGMGTVFRAHDELFARDVAVKLMAGDLAADDLAVRRFKREAGVCARLHHPNIVAGLDSGYDERSDRHFIVLELVDGDDVGTLADRHGQLGVAEILGMVAQICDALSYAHGQGIVHGDVSPGNIVISRSDRTAKLTDFGLARPLWSVRETTPGRVAGTPRYLAPEVARGECATPLSDLYSLGSVAQRLMTVESPRLRRDGVPRAAADAVEKALACDPAERHASVAEFRDQLMAGRLARAA
jgi:serine/threonine protein kinase